MNLSYYHKGAFQIGTTNVPLSFDSELLELNPKENIAQLGVERLAVIKQVHGTDILEYSHSHLNSLMPQPVNVIGIADGLILKEAEFAKPKYCSCAIGIRTADCLPIIFELNKNIGLLHAGWRGLSLGAIEKMINRLRAISPTSEELKVWIGPAAKKCCYEVGEEVLSSLDVCNKNCNSHSNIDLQEIAENKINKLYDKVNIFVDRRCTICNKEFYSYRRNKTKSRNLTFLAF